MSKVVRIPNQEKPKNPSFTVFKEFEPYEGGRKRKLKFDVNALADFEQETGMGFAQLMKQRAIFASARAFLWAGLKHEDRGLMMEQVGTLIGQYLQDDTVARGEHTIDNLLTVAFQAAIDQGALGLQKVEEDEDGEPDPTTLALPVEGTAEPTE